MAFTLELGMTAPDFDLPGVDGSRYSLASFADAPALAVVFACNHCPYVIGSEDRMNALYADYGGRGMALVSINSNETDGHPTDSFEHMQERARDKGFQFPYLRDESQATALAYGALRTPHFYLFDGDRKLRYTGRLDDNPMDSAQGDHPRAARRAGRGAGRQGGTGAADQPDRLQRQVEEPGRPLDATGGVRPGVSRHRHSVARNATNGGQVRGRRRTVRPGRRRQPGDRHGGAGAGARRPVAAPPRGTRHGVRPPRGAPAAEARGRQGHPARQVGHLGGRTPGGRRELPVRRRARNAGGAGPGDRPGRPGAAARVRGQLRGGDRARAQLPGA